MLSLHPDDPYWAELQLHSDKPLHTVSGGKERSDSVLNALDYLASSVQLSNDRWVMVHDAARPCLSQNDIDFLIETLADDDVGGILASPVRDTMKRATEDQSHILHTENRDGLWHALTPQMFRFGVLKEALNNALQLGVAITDDASAIEELGLSSRLVEGDANNIKITKPSDLALAEFFLSRGEQQ